MNQKTEGYGRFILSGEWPKECKHKVIECVKNLDWLLPQSYVSCYLYYEPKENESICYCNSEHAYRRFNITFSPQFISLRPKERLASIVHELVHANNLMISDFAKEEFERLLPENESPKYRSSILARLTEVTEQATCDMTEIIIKRYETNS